MRARRAVLVTLAVVGICVYFFMYHPGSHHDTGRSEQILSTSLISGNDTSKSFLVTYTTPEPMWTSQTLEPVTVELVTVESKNSETVTPARNNDRNNVDSPVPSTTKNLTVLYEESEDVFSLLPSNYLPDYKSFCWYDKQDTFQCLPSIYLAGFPKCGTTDLFYKLTTHPDLVSQTHHGTQGDLTDGKEFHYWTRARIRRPLGLYVRLPVLPPWYPFSTFLQGTGVQKVTRPEVQIVDGTPSLLWDLLFWEDRYPGASQPPYSNADLIHALTPAAKIVAILRDPVDRLYSDYLYFYKTVKKLRFRPVTPETFDKESRHEVNKFNRCLKEGNSTRHCCYSKDNNLVIRVTIGVYICYIRDWKEVFKDNLLVLTLDQYHGQPEQTLEKVFKFVGAALPESYDSYFGNVTENTNSQLREKHGEMLPSTRMVLKEFYDKYNRELAAYLDDDAYLFENN